MYDQIFDDFNTIKEHSERNGNNKFEESAVFELLESLYPSHGSIKAVQIIIEMLDAQRIRDSKSMLDKSIPESDSKKPTTDDENDTDIIEIKVPKKIHPFIDLTENSTESDEAVIIEKSENKSTIENVEINSDSNIETYDSEASCHEIHSFSDSDASKHFNEDSNLTSDDLTRSNSEKQLLNYLAILDQSNQTSRLGGEQSNNGSVDVPEMLEENNNDPNNNFDEENTDANHTVINHSNNSNILHDTEPSHSDKALDEFYPKFLNPVSVPGCSKEIKPIFELNGTNGSANTLFIPIPGCSKDILDIPEDFELPIIDDLIEKDANCVQEIIPWASLDNIRLILCRYKDIPDRKQLTLFKLMKYENKKIKAHAMKRKSNNPSEIDSKFLKLDAMLGMDQPLDVNTNLPFDSIHSNESSNDSISSKRSGQIEPTFKIKQNFQTVINSELSKASLGYKQCDLSNNLKSSLKMPSCKLVYSNSLDNMPATNHVIKKERNETIVSGLLQEQNHLEMLHGKIERFIPAPLATLLDLPINEPFFSNDNDFRFLANNDLFNHQVNDETIEKMVQEEPDNFLNDIPSMNGSPNNSKGKPVIQPPKLLLQNAQTVVNPVSVTTPKSSFMRPAILKFNNDQQSIQKKVVPELKDNIHGRVYSNYVARQKDYIPPPLRVIQKQLPVQKLIMPLPPLETVTHKNEGDRNNAKIIKNAATNDAHYKNQNVLQNNRPVNVIKYRQKSGNPDTVKILSKQVQARPLHNNQVVQPGTSGANPNTPSTTTGILHQSIYNKLRSIFPDVDSSYIKKICINPPNVNSTNDKTFILNALIEHLLNEGENHLRPVEYVIDQPNIASVSVDEKYEYLVGIFPDADPTYIRDFVVQNPSEQDFEQFIQRKLESRDYPTKEQYMARIKITEQIKQYTADLNIDKFLELFPDPFKHFENTSRKCLYQPIAMEFLKSLFVKNKVTTITQRYKSNNHNLSLTAKALTELGPDMKSKRVSVEMPTEDIPLLQEIAFIKNKQNIVNHLNMLKNKEEQLFKELKDQNLLLTCQCCFNDECMPTKSSECNEGHVFCHECIIRGTESALADAEANVRCFTDCKSEFSLATLQKVLPPTKFSALLQKRQTAEVIAAGMDGLVSCPFCHFASIPPPEDKVFKCLNPDCMKETCKMCKELNHVPLKCDEVIKTDKARHMIEEKMTEALVRTCYQCKKQFYKEDGCNKMKCTCGALMCYLCSKPIKGYDHFNAQGGANTHLCPLWSDDRLLNAKAVIKVAEDVKKVLLKNNPNLKIDTDSLLPKIPPKTRGPHDDIPNANQLPEHIMRIAARR